jgi:HK97 family phage prohead protease
VDAAEVRCDLATTLPSIVGVAHRYGSISAPMKDGKGRLYREKFRPGAFGRSLASGADVRCLVNHDANLIMGRITAGTLTLQDDVDALRFTVQWPPTELARHYAEAVKRRDMTGMSFRFYAIRDAWTETQGGLTREVIEADLDEISVVTFPAYMDSEASIRSDPAGDSLDDHLTKLAASRQRASARNAVRIRLAKAL